MLRFMVHDTGKLCGDAKPIIAINMGVVGQLSRILSMTFTPVTHPLLPTRQPSQLSSSNQKALHLVASSRQSSSTSLEKPIAHSMSPTLHNTAFNRLASRTPTAPRNRSS